MMFLDSMICRGRFIPFLLVALLMRTGWCLPQSDKSDDLNQKLSFRFPVGRVEGTFVEALGETARAFNIPMGISWVNTASSRRKRTVKYKDATVLEIIEDIAIDAIAVGVPLQMRIKRGCVVGRVDRQHLFGRLRRHRRYKTCKDGGNESQLCHPRWATPTRGSREFQRPS